MCNRVSHAVMIMLYTLLLASSLHPLAYHSNHNYFTSHYYWPHHDRFFNVHIYTTAQLIIAEGSAL